MRPGGLLRQASRPRSAAGEPGVPDADRQNEQSEETADGRFGEVWLEASTGVPAHQPAGTEGDPNSPVRGNGAVMVGREQQEGCDTRH